MNNEKENLIEETQVAYNAKNDWTYEDYLKIEDENRYEIIDGKIYMRNIRCTGFSS